MHGLKQFTTLVSLTALVCLSINSPSTTVLATEVVPNISFLQRDLLSYSRSAAEASKAAQFALTGFSSTPSSAGLLEVDSSLQVLKKRRCKSKGKKNHNHKHHHHHKGAHKEKNQSTNQEDVTQEKCDTSDEEIKDVKSTSTKTVTSSTTHSTNVDDLKTSSSSNSGNVTTSSGSGSYQRVQQNRGSNFWSGNNFQFFTYADPTHGQVQFESENSAKSQGLIGMKNGAAFMRASNKDISGGNRPSVRFTSKKAYDSGLIIFDVAKMPVGCATWPALWTTKGDTWPRNGEIDVVEGVGYTSGGRNTNQMTVHLGQNSPLSLKRRGLEKRGASYTGKLMQGASNCNQWGGGSNSGCAFFDSNAHGPSWGTPFNTAGGGVWAMQFGNDQGVKIWFWGRKSGLLPSELSKANVSPDKLDPTSWGTPMANFQSNVINSMVKAQNIIMDITIGGDWAGNVPMDGQCKGQNLQQAIKKGSNYDDAEFIINGIDIYCKNGKC